MKPVDVKSNTYIDFGIENNEIDLKFEVFDHLRISKYKNIKCRYKKCVIFQNHKPVVKIN